MQEKEIVSLCPCFLLLKGRTGLSSISSNLAQLLQLQVNKTKADMWSMSPDAGRTSILQQDGK